MMQPTTDPMLLLLRVLALFILCASTPASAHVVEQLYVQSAITDGTWKLEVTFDAGYALPESRGDPFSPQPTRDWLVALPKDEQLALCTGAESYLRECLQFTKGDLEIPTRYGFPDLEDEPPNFPHLLNGGAYLTVTISPASPTPGTAILNVASGQRPDFLLKRPPIEGEGDRYVTVEPGGSCEVGTDSGDSVFWAGFTHVIPKGVDHLLFVLGLFLLNRRGRPLLVQSLVFTVAHSVTLGLVSAGVFVPAQSWVEPAIALSIAVLAIENLLRSELSRGRLILVFGFGLIHGMGFADALAPVLHDGGHDADGGFLLRLLLANLGVETAQVAILLAAWALIIKWSARPCYTTVRRWANFALLAVALYWFASRLLHLL